MGTSHLNAEIGEEKKKKLKEIAESQERSMTGQLRVMIDHFYEKVVGTE